MKHRVYVMFEIVDQTGTDNPTALPDMMATVHNFLRSQGIGFFRGRIVKGESVDDEAKNANG